MTVDRSYRGGGGAGEQFPVGMRVLAVDDDPFCLKLLQTLLHKCRYHVTTTSQATEALKMLRENKDMFDLVISDVHMPDMDGFKLLELVGLEMDLPVIMLSANDDTNLVMKGIIHGACDYLLKPVRMEELKNIWQHVVRKKKKVQPIGMNNFDKHEHESGQSLVVTEDSDQNSKLDRKRKGQKEDDDEDRENGLSNEDSSVQKKARLVWTPELHRKFLAAVKTLGIDNAVPKKILNLMNVEKLTRENVASHLQKYKRLLDRISSEANQHPNMVAALGGLDAAYLRMTSLSGHVNLQNSAVRPFSSNGLLGSRLRNPTGLPMHAIPSSGTLQSGHAQNLKNPNNMQPNFQPVINPGNQNENKFKGMTTSYNYGQLQFGDCGGNHSERPPDFTAKSSVFPISSNVNQSCGTVPFPNMEFPSELLGFGGCAASGSSSQPNLLTPSDVLRTTISTDLGNIIFPAHLNSCIPSINGTSDLRSDFIQKLRSEENNFSAYQNPNSVCNSMNSMISSCGVLDSLIEYNDTLDNWNSEFGRNNDLDVVEMQSLAVPQIMQQTVVDQSVLQTVYNVDQINQLGGYSYNDGGSLEDIVSALVKLDQDMFM